MLTLDGSSTHWERQLGWNTFVSAEKGKTRKSFTSFRFKDEDGKSPAGWNVKGVRKQPDTVACHRCDWKRTQSHPGGKKERKKNPTTPKGAPNPVKDRKEERGRKRWQERSPLPSSSMLFGVETPRNDKMGRHVWFSSRLRVLRTTRVLLDSLFKQRCRNFEVTLQKKTALLAEEQPP